MATGLLQVGIAIDSRVFSSSTSDQPEPPSVCSRNQPARVESNISKLDGRITGRMVLKAIGPLWISRIGELSMIKSCIYPNDRGSRQLQNRYCTLGLHKASCWPSQRRRCKVRPAAMRH